MNSQSHALSLLKGRISRREFLRGMTAAVAAAGGSTFLTACAVPPAAAPAAEEAAPATPAAPAEKIELVHWHPLTASDGDIWEQLIDQFNAANAERGLSISTDVVPYSEIGTKTLGAFAAGTPPDFGWADGVKVNFIEQGVVTEVKELMAGVGLDWSDFLPNVLENLTYKGKLYVVPMDSSNVQMLINATHAQEAGLDVSNPPQTGEDLIEWALAMTQRDGDTVTRSGFLLTGSGLLPANVWGIVAEQIGFERFNADYTKVNVVNDACRQAAQWVLDLFDKHKVSDRDIADRYKAFGTGQGSIFWTGQWTLSGYMEQEGLEFTTTKIPLIGNQLWTEGWDSGLEIYQQKDAARIQATAEAIKWLSDNSLLWNVEGRGATPRKSIRANPAYTQGKKVPWELKQPFEEGLEFSFSAIPPVANGGEFDYYGAASLTKHLDGVWNGSVSIEEGLQALQEEWQRLLDEA